MQYNLSLLIVVLALVCSGTFAAPPTKRPTAVPTALPTARPSAKPTAKPTASPSAKPTVVPTAKPSTATPTAKPTPKPSAMPSAKPTPEPTTNPTVLPTDSPTTAPTLEPTVKPTFVPTLSPTTAPTLEPTVAPTLQPTDEPTLFPSAEPTTAAPSRSPTIKPTAVPTLTRMPTQSPTRRTSPLVTYYANVTINGVAQPYIDTDGQAVVTMVVAALMGFPSNAVTYLSTGKALPYPDRRRLSDNLWDMPVSLKIQIVMAQTEYLTSDDLYQSSRNNLETALLNGDFDTKIQAMANTEGTPDLLQASAYHGTFSAATEEAPPDVQKEEIGGLTEGGTAIIVICVLVMVGVILYMLYDHNKGPKHADDHAPKGYAVTEDDEPINKL